MNDELSSKGKIKAKRKEQSAERKVQSAERKVQRAERKALGAERKVEFRTCILLNLNLHKKELNIIFTV